MKMLAIAAVVLLLARHAAEAAPPVTALAFAPDGRSLVVGSSAGVEVRSWPELCPERSLPTRVKHVNDLAFSPAGDALLVAGGRPGEAGEVERLAWPEGRPEWLEAPHDDLVTAVAWRADGLAFVTAGSDGLALVHEVTGGDPVPLEGHSRGVTAAAFVGDSLVTTGLDQSVRAWEPRTGRLVRSLNNHNGPVFGLAARPGLAAGALPMAATVGGDRTARLWQPTIGRMVRLSRLESPGLAVAWSPDGSALAVALADGRVTLIDPENAQVSPALPAVEGWAYSLAFAPAGDSLAVGGEGGRVVRLVLDRRAPVGDAR